MFNHQNWADQDARQLIRTHENLVLTNLARILAKLYRLTVILGVRFVASDIILYQVDWLDEIRILFAS